MTPSNKNFTIGIYVSGPGGLYSNTLKSVHPLLGISSDFIDLKMHSICTKLFLAIGIKWYIKEKDYIVAFMLNDRLKKDISIGFKN